MSVAKFPCSSCGACCRRIGDIVSVATKMVKEGSSHPFIAAFASFPYSYKEDGSCVQLNEQHQCSVYSSRPDVCSIDAVWKLFFKDQDKYVNINAFYKHNAQICNKLVQKDGLPEAYIIDMELFDT